MLNHDFEGSFYELVDDDAYRFLENCLDQAL
jgi:hypothetical protein